MRQHDAHVSTRIDYLIDWIAKQLFAPAEAGWNDWSRYAASGEWF